MQCTKQTKKMFFDLIITIIFFYVIAYLIALSNLQVRTTICGAVDIILGHFSQTLSLFLFKATDHQS